MKPGPDRGDGVSTALLAAPSDAGALAGRIRDLSDATAVFRWFRRLATLPSRDIEGDVLRRAIVASASVDAGVLRRMAASAAAPRDRQTESFVAAALLVNRRLNIPAFSAAPIHFRVAGDGFQRVLGVLSERAIPDSIQAAFDLMIAKQHLLATLQRAGYFDEAEAMSRNASAFSRRIRRNLYGEESRGFTEQWTFAIGHLVLLAFLIKGMDAGLFDFARARVWAGRAANPALLRQVLALSPDVEVVPPWSTFADNHSSGLLEWIDGRFVDCFEACGIVADTAGDAGGAILAKPDGSHPELVRFRDAVGWTPDDRIVTVHCREAGFRVNDRHDLRNVDIADYVAALKALVARGYRVVRLGDPTMTPLPAIDGVVDYATSTVKSPELDILLPAVARFHIGSSSGLSLVPLLYGVPSLFLNWHPIDMLPWGRRNWTVMKPLVALADRRRVVDPAGYAALGRVREMPLLQSFGYTTCGLAPADIERVTLAFADAVEADAPPPRVGRNLGRVLAADEAGDLHDLMPAVQG